MAEEQFIHGVRVLEVASGPRPVTTVRSAIIGIVGTAPLADATAFPLNTPVMIAGSRAEAAKLALTAGDRGTLPQALDDIFAQAGAVVVVVRVEKGVSETATMANIIAGARHLIDAESILGVAPRILLAPGFTHQRPADAENVGEFLANPVVSELVTVAERLRAVIIADGPNTTDADAQAYADDFGSRRIYLHDPWDKKLDAAGEIITVPASARIAGQIVKSDNERGFWWSPSNQEANGVIGTSRPIDFAMGDPASRANLLNEAGIATTIRQDGYRLWGNRTLSADPKWTFLSVVRTADIINDSLLRAHLWAVDRNITKTYLADVVESVNAYLRYLKSIGAILGGVCYADPDLNTPAQIAQGKVYFDFDFTPPFPAEQIIFRSTMTNDYISEIF